MKIALYARVSTADKGQDPEMQLRELREYCERRVELHRKLVGLPYRKTEAWDSLAEDCLHAFAQLHHRGKRVGVQRDLAIFKWANRQSPSALLQPAN